ncbi:hypothetical protein G7Y89_g9902 [Cudoniella acicularis]|uniref:DUF7702 domain-containing protein n=1 Tax=Cudoniella acicularis TaxID=354080 RepID=A0A8H4VZK7_9HELO|nr:hypothetical protein G7Y89_g9902 [Cudoniella acicularis]
MVAYREIISIVQVSFYAPAILGGIFLAFRHGFAKSSGWVLLITFSLLRLVGAVLEIVAISNPTKQVVTGAMVCTSIGLSPLTLMCLGLMDRVNHQVGDPIPRKVNIAVNLLGLVALFLGIHGGSQQANSANAADYMDVNNESKIACLMFTGIFIIALLIFLVLIGQLSIVPAGEKRLLLAVGLAAPFLAVRYIYALLADFAQNKNFNSYFGNPTIYLLMAVLAEIGVVVIIESIGFTLRVLRKHEKLSSSDMEMPGRMSIGARDSFAYEEDVPLHKGLAGPAGPPKTGYRESLRY